jgi:transcriptional regulator with XRE-family HTH domain
MKKIGLRIKKIRLERNYTQEYLATSLQITARAYQNIENNKSELTVRRLLEIAILLDVKPFDLLDEDLSI